MNRTMNHERRRIQMPPPVLPAGDNLPLMIDLDQVLGRDLGKGDPERIHPEGGRGDGVADGDVARYTFFEAVFGKDAEGQGEAGFEVFAFFLFGGGGGWAGDGGFYPC